MNTHSSRLGASILSLGLVLGLGACAGQSDSTDERVYDARSNDLQVAARDVGAAASEGAAGRRVIRVSAESQSVDASRRSASYAIRTGNGKSFRVTATHRIQRDGADEIITAEDLETGEIVSAAFGAESAVYTAADGHALAATGDDETETLTFHTSVGAQTIPLAGIAEDSPEEKLLLQVLSLMLVGETGYSQDQVEALSAAMAAADADLGASGMSIWGKAKKALKKVVSTVSDAMCTSAAQTVCDTMYSGGMACIGFAAMASGAIITAPVAVGVAGGCLGVTVLGAACSIGQFYGCD